MAETWDVFISNAHTDQDWVQRLAATLHHLGLDVFLDAWEVGPGDVLVHHIQCARRCGGECRRGTGGT